MYKTCFVVFILGKIILTKNWHVGNHLLVGSQLLVLEAHNNHNSMSVPVTLLFNVWPTKVAINITTIDNTKKSFTKLCNRFFLRDSEIVISIIESKRKHTSLVTLNFARNSHL